jgi:tetratricopeptide (TPR) repeat protein
VVYEALDRTRGTRVALKTLRSRSDHAVALLKREFENLRRARHENVVAFGELHTEEDESYFTMELVEGVGFLEYVHGDAAGRPFHEGRLRHALCQLAAGLGAVHGAGLVHSDVKPSNVRVTSDERLVLLDLGLAVEAGSARASFAGTPAYMAPEQAAGGAIDPAADWYGVGVVLYEALTGELPVKGSELSVVAQKQSADIVPPSAIVPSVPPDLDGLCLALLRFDPRSRPTARRVLRLAGATAPGPYASRTRETPFVGRSDELAALERTYAAVERGGDTRSVLVWGEQGVGKRALIQRFLGTLRANHPETLTLIGRSYSCNTTPFPGLDGIVNALGRALARLPEQQVRDLVPKDITPLARMFPALARYAMPIAMQLPPEPEASPKGHSLEPRRLALGALRELLAGLARGRPIVIVLEGAQHLDLDSQLLLRELLWPPEPPRLLILAVADPPSHGSDVATERVLREVLQAADALELRPLPHAEGRELAAVLLERAGAADTIDPGALADDAGGNPLLIDALAQWGAAAPRSTERGGETDHLALFREVFSRAVQSLDEPSRCVLETLAIAGGPLEETVLARATRLEGALQRSVAALRVGHLLLPDDASGPARVDIAHAVVRDVVCARLSPETAKALHARIAVTLDLPGDGTDLGAASRHWESAGDAAQAAGVAAAAAENAAERFAFHRAAALYERALSLGNDRDEKLRRLRSSLGDALVAAGECTGAAAAFQAAAEGAPAAEELDLRRRAALQLLHAAHLEEAFAEIRRVLASIGQRLPRTALGALVLFVLGRVYLRIRGLRFEERDPADVSERDLVRLDTCWSIALGLGVIDTLHGAALQTQHIVLALRAGEPFRAARALGMELGFTALEGGRTWRRTEALMAQATALAEKTGRPESIAMNLFACGMAYNLGQDWTRAIELWDRALTTLRRHGMALEAATAEWNIVDGLSWIGGHRELKERLTLWLREAESRGDVYSVVNLRLFGGSFAWLVADDVDQARVDLVDALGRWPDRGLDIQRFKGLLAKARLDLYAGDPSLAYEALAVNWPAIRSSHLLAVQTLRIYSYGFRGTACVAAAEMRARKKGPGGAEELLARAERDARALERERWGTSQPLALLLRAGIAMVASGDTTRARRLLEQALGGFERIHLRLHVAATRRCLGLLLGGDEGRSLVADADAAMSAETVRNPARMTRLLAPGFARLGE